MPDTFRRVYLDSNVYLAVIKGEEGRLDIARPLLREAEAGHYELFASTLVYAEVCGEGSVRAVTGAQQIAVDDMISQFFEQSRFIRWVEVDFPIARVARRLSRELGLRGADAIHMASAQRAVCDALMTWDAKDCPIGSTVGSVRVQKPVPFGQGTLDV